jgi:hypothetical protein
LDLIGPLRAVAEFALRIITAWNSSKKRETRQLLTMCDSLAPGNQTFGIFKIG